MTPEGWRASILKDLIAKVATGVSVNSEGRPRGQGEVGVLKTSAVSYGVFRPEENKVVRADDHHRARLNPKKDSVLVSRMNTLSLVGASAYVDRDWPDLVLPDRIWALTPNRARAHGRWLHYLLSSATVRRALIDAAAGTSGSMKNISQERFLGLQVLEPPLPEQRKIATILSSVDDTIEKTQAVIDQVQVVQTSLMQELLTRGRPGRHAKFKKTEIGEIPEEWGVAPFGHVVEQVKRPVSVLPHMTYREIGVRSHGKGVFHKEPVTGSQLGEKKVFWVEPGCLVLNIVFAWERAVAWTADPEDGMIASHRFPMFKPRHGIADLRFLTLFLLSHVGHRALQSVSPGGAGRNKTLNQGAFLKLPVPLPPLEEQQAIGVGYQVAADRLRADERTLGTLRAVRAGLMHLLLTGEVRVLSGPETT